MLLVGVARKETHLLPARPKFGELGDGPHRYAFAKARRTTPAADVFPPVAPTSHRRADFPPAALTSHPPR
jgi:hypothetical protein